MVSRIIISRTDSIGDVMLTLPMCGALKKQFPNCTIIFLGKSYTKDVVACCEHVDQFENWDSYQGLCSLEQIEKMRALGADAIVHVFPRKEIVQLAKRSGIKRRIATGRRWYTITKCNELVFFSRKKSPLHESQLNLKLLRPFGIKHEFSLQEVGSLYGFTRIPTEAIEKAEQLLQGKEHLIKVVLHPLSKGSAVEWGVPQFSALAHLLPSSKYAVFVTGTSQEGERIAELGGIPSAINLTGQLSLLELVAFISKCDALVAASTGPLHIAAALGIRAIGLYTPKRPMHPGRWSPVGKKAEVLVAAQHPSPGEFLSITPEEVVALLER
jgi:ADP-heptose:LPS heptosyltransferase